MLRPRSLCRLIGVAFQLRNIGADGTDDERFVDARESRVERLRLGKIGDGNLNRASELRLEELARRIETVAPRGTPG